MSASPVPSVSSSTAAPEAAPGIPDTAPVRIVQVGVQGFGAKHLAAIDRLAAAGRAELVGMVDARFAEDAELPEVPRYSDLAEALEAHPEAEVVSIATPIHTHLPLALTAVRAGRDVLLEKPTVASLEQFETLLTAAREHGRLVQVGFQSFGSHTLGDIASRLSDGEIGELQSIGAIGVWSRPEDYFTRSAWSGKRVIGGVPVVDGVMTNPLAHAVATALLIGGATEVSDVLGVDLELYRANAIESDDTSSVHVSTRSGVPVNGAFTLCDTAQADPYIVLRGTTGRMIFHYTRDRLEVLPDGGESTVVEHGRTALLENLLDARLGKAELLAPLAGTGAFMRVLEAVRTAPEPRPIAASFTERLVDERGARIIVPGIAELLERSIRAGAPLSSIGAPWATRPAEGEHLFIGTHEVARVRTGTELDVRNSPRPFLHPVRTLGGVTVTDQQPFDHPWHLGVGVALQDVDGTNHWGGRTYLRDRGYTWRADHGRIVRVGSRIGSSAEAASGAPSTAVGSGSTRLSERLAWLTPAGLTHVREDRTWTVTGRGDDAWDLDLDLTLSPTAGKTVSFGSPGSNGRAAGGYGGFFVRLAPVADARVFTPEAEGEDAVHGTISEWIAYSGEFPEGPATLVLRRRTPENPTASSTEPWFVRVKGYPGLGASLAWDEPVVTDSPLRRSYSLSLLDGIVDTAGVAAYLDR